MHARGDNTLRGLGEGNAWPLSVRQAVEKIEQQAAKIKTKWSERKRSDPRRRVPPTGRAGSAPGRAGPASAPRRSSSAPISRRPTDGRRV